MPLPNSTIDLCHILDRLAHIEAQLMIRASVERWNETGEDPFYDIAELVSVLRADIQACL